MIHAIEILVLGIGFKISVPSESKITGRLRAQTYPKRLLEEFNW
jgi:hypothetical protein